MSEAILTYHHGVWSGECEDYALSMSDDAFKEAIETWLAVRNVPNPSLQQRWIAVFHCRRLSYWDGFWKYRESRVKMVLKQREKG